MIKIIFMLYNSLLLSFVLSVIAFKIQWLEMRMNIGILIPIFTTIIFCSFYFVSKLKIASVKRYKLFTSINLLLSLFIVYIFLGARGFLVVPASIIRELLSITTVSFMHINFAILFFLLTGFITIILGKE